MADLGVCDRCAAPAVVVVNENRACLEHLDSVMQLAFGPVREAMEKALEEPLVDSDPDAGISTETAYAALAHAAAGRVSLRPPLQPSLEAELEPGEINLEACPVCGYDPHAAHE